jgi:hypothetical protein
MHTSAIMLIDQAIDTTLLVRDVIAFCVDKHARALAELREQYAGRCFKGTYIVEIKAITRISSCRIATTNNSAEGTIDVQFVAGTHAFSRWDILVGVEIVSQQGMLTGLYVADDGARAVVTLLASRAVETLTVGQRIAVRVVVAQHQPMQTHAAVVATLLTCDSRAAVYSVRGSLDVRLAPELGDLLGRIRSELAARTTLLGTNRAAVFMFEALLYSHPPELGVDTTHPTVGGLEWQGPPTRSAPAAVDLLALVQRATEMPTDMTGGWTRGLALCRSSPLVQREDPLGAVDATPRAVVGEMLKNMLDYLVAVRELVALYPTAAALSANANVWSAMRAAQRPS